MSKKGKFILGAAIGAGLGLLFAPKTGKETREDLKKKIDELAAKAKEIDIQEVKASFLNKIDELKEDFKDLDREKAAKIAKEKAIAIEKKTEELVKMAKEAAKPKLEELANGVKKQTTKTLKAVVAKLEDEKPKKTKKAL